MQEGVSGGPLTALRRVWRSGITLSAAGAFGCGYSDFRLRRQSERRTQGVNNAIGEGTLRLGKFIVSIYYLPRMIFWESSVK